MLKLDELKIKSIAEDLDTGFDCYVNKINGEVITIPSEIHHSEMDLNEWKDDLKKIKNDKKNYFLVEALQPWENFKIMESFIAEVNSPELQNRLISALNKKHPFRNFKFEIDNSEWREKWFSFKAESLQEYVRDRLKVNVQEAADKL